MENQRINKRVKSVQQQNSSTSEVSRSPIRSLAQKNVRNRSVGTTDAISKFTIQKTTHLPKVIEEIPTGTDSNINSNKNVPPETSSFFQMVRKRAKNETFYKNIESRFKFCEIDIKTNVDEALKDFPEIDDVKISQDDRYIDIPNISLLNFGSIDKIPNLFEPKKIINNFKEAEILKINSVQKLFISPSYLWRIWFTREVRELLYYQFWLIFIFKFKPHQTYLIEEMRPKIGVLYRQFFLKIREKKYEYTTVIIFCFGITIHGLFLDTFKNDLVKIDQRFMYDCFHIILFELNGILVSDKYVTKGINDYFHKVFAEGTNDMTILEDKLNLPKFFKIKPDKSQQPKKLTTETKKMEKDLKIKTQMLKSIKQSKTAQIYNAVKNVRFMDLVNGERNPQMEAKIMNFIKRKFVDNSVDDKQLDGKEDQYYLSTIRFDSLQTSPCFSMDDHKGNISKEQSKLFGRNLIGNFDDKTITDIAEAYDRIREKHGPVKFKENKKEEQVMHNLLKILTKDKMKKNKDKSNQNGQSSDDALVNEVQRLKNRAKSVSAWDKIMNQGKKDQKNVSNEYTRRRNNFTEMKRALDANSCNQSEFYYKDREINNKTKFEYESDFITDFIKEMKKQEERQFNESNTLLPDPAETDKRRISTEKSSGQKDITMSDDNARENHIKDHSQYRTESKFAMSKIDLKSDRNINKNTEYSGSMEITPRAENSDSIKGFGDVSRQNSRQITPTLEYIPKSPEVCTSGRNKDIKRISGFKYKLDLR